MLPLTINFFLITTESATSQILKCLEMKRSVNVSIDAEETPKRSKLTDSVIVQGNAEQEALALYGEEMGEVENSSSEEKFDDDEEEVADADAEPVELEQYFLPVNPLKPVNKSINWTTPFMSEVGPGIHEYTAADLELVPAFSEVYGMRNIRDMLMSRIYRIVQNPKRYRIGEPLLNSISLVQRLFYLFGRHGTGVDLLIKAFCKETGISLVEARGTLFSPERDLQELYRLAETIQPCIVLFTDCEHHFFKGSPFVVQLTQLLENITQRNAPVWTLFRAELAVTSLDSRLSNLVDYPLWSEVPTLMERGQIWLKALLPYLRKRSDKRPAVSKRELRSLIDKSVDCIPRNIFGFVRHCYNQKIASLEDESPLHTDDDVMLEIRDLVFINLPEMRARITASDPTQDNIREFVQVASVPMRNARPIRK